MAKTVQDLLHDIRLLGEDQFQIVAAVRQMMKQSVKNLTEEVKYGGIMFSAGTPFGGVFAYKDHVSVEFGHGAKVHDTFGFLEGNGKGRRHIKLKAIDDLAVKKLEEYIPLAVAAAKSGA
jgi:hypothetical protein